MSLYKQLGLKIPKQDIRNKSRNEILTPYLLLSLLIYIQDVDTIDQMDLKQQQNLVKQYGILTNNQYLISSKDVTLQKITRYLIPQIRIFTKNNIVKMIFNTINLIKFELAIPSALKLTYRFTEHQLTDMLQTYQTIAIELNGSQFDFSTLNIPLVNIYTNLVSFIQEWNINPTSSKFQKIIIATKCFLYGYFLTQAKNTLSGGINNKSPIPNINPLDLLHHEETYVDLFTKFLSDVDSSLERNIAITTDTLLALGSYTKPIIWNLINKHCLQYVPFFIDIENMYNDTSTQILLRATIALLLL